MDDEQLGSQFLQSGVNTSLRFLFAKTGVSECDGVAISASSPSNNQNATLGVKQGATTMKTLSMIAGLVSTFVIPLASAANAQMQGSSQGPMEMESAQRVALVLNLSPAQQWQLRPILEAEAPKVKAIVQNPNLTMKEKQKELKNVYSQTDPLVQSILTPTQYGHWKTIRKDEIKQVN